MQGEVLAYFYVSLTLASVALIVALLYHTLRLIPLHHLSVHLTCVNLLTVIITHIYS